MPVAYLVPIGGAFLVVLLLFQLLVGRRNIQFKGKLHMKVHRVTGWVLVIAAPLHGIFALHTFFAWPF